MEWFAQAKWKNRRMEEADPANPALVVQKERTEYAIEVKAAAEGRGDRLVALWAQACLQVRRVAGDRYLPLAVVAAPKITPRVAEQVLAFAAKNAPDVAVGVIDFAGLRRFRGLHLDGLDMPDAEFSPAVRPAIEAVHPRSTNLFSDLNQWMLKVLLAPELAERLLSAPRDQYRNASQLARAANVSIMSAFRFVQQLEHDGYLDRSYPYLRLVRRDDLLHRWQTWGSIPSAHEVPMRFLLRGEAKTELRRMFVDGSAGGPACVALFAAAEFLHLGFVQGVPPYVYVMRLDQASVTAWKHLAPAAPGETPDVILRQAPVRQSISRGMVQADDVPVTDALQVWLDVSSHPARGREQADLIRRRVIAPLLDEQPTGEATARHPRA